MKNNILVLGVGNYILGDEGVGIHIIEALKNEPLNCDLLDGGTGGVGLIGILEEYKKIIIIDATLDNTPPGTIKQIKPKFSKDYPILMSSHEFGLRDMIEAMTIRETLPEIDLITISVKNYQDIKIGLSPQIQQVIPTVVNKVVNLVTNS